MKPVAMAQRSVLLSVLVTALVLAASSASAPRKSSQDQYQPRDDQAQTETNGHQPLVHRVQLSSSGVHRFGLLPQSHTQEKPGVQELQVGCGDGSVKVKPKKTGEIQVINKKRFRRDTENTREKRDYIRWYGSANTQYNPPIQSIQFHGVPSVQNRIPVVNQWNNGYQQPYQQPFQQPFQQPYRQPYQIFIPIWGNPRTIPVFFPQKPILFNPGYPIANPPRPSVQPLPTPEPTTEIPNEESESSVPGGMSLGNRFGDPNSLTDDQDAPIWGIVESEEQVGGSPLRTTTRRPPPVQATKPPTPPLFHRPSGGTGGQGNSQSQQGNLPSQSQSQPSFTEDPLSLQNIRTTTTTPAPITMSQRPDRQLNRCVWAIISCCNPTNTQIRYNCFENLGCPGAFWDRNPCSKDVTQAALNAAQEFYASV